MRASAFFLLLCVLVGLIHQWMAMDQARAVDLLPDFLFRKKPVSHRLPSVEDLAKQADYLEHHLETFGTVVPKHPDVWGQARLTKHRQEFERLMQGQLGKFEPTLQGSLRRSDQAFVGMAMALGASAGEAAAPTTNVAVGMLSDPTAGSEVILRNQRNIPPDLTNFREKQISLEPVTYIDQMKRYLDHLNQLRRINEGDDTSDSPGYSLNLVRIPVSVIAGKRTREGFGAEITITAQPYLSDELLPTTFRNLVVNDVVDQLALPMVRVLEDRELLDNLQKAIDAWDNEEREPKKKVVGPDGTAIRVEGDHEKEQRFLNTYQLRGLSDRIHIRSLPSVAHTRRSRLPFPQSQLRDVFGQVHVLGHVIVDARPLVDHPANGRHVHILDVRGHLRAEVDAAYDFLCLPEAAILWQHCTPVLASAIHGRQRTKADVQPDTTSIRDLRDAYFDDLKLHFPRATHSGTASLIWAILAESALLNKRLMGDMEEVSVAKGCGCFPKEAGWFDFYAPRPSAEARALFNQYVMCRWPIQVFALDPVTDEQNIADVFSRRRELQMAMAAGVANGNVSAQAAGRFARRLETDMETISLNRTIVGFSHGQDTFGWRFYPRFQSPPTRGNLRAFGETLWGGPTTDQDLRARRLEPGIRECVAIVVMPSFVPYVTFDSRANWFSLTHPQKLELTLHETMRLSRTYKAVRDATECMRDADCYRPGDLSRLVRVVDQLDRQMPLQTMMVQVPYENTLGGFEMFNTGVSDLGPELIGWHGAPGIRLKADTACNLQVDRVAQLAALEVQPQCAQHCPGTTLFLVGDHFSVHDTKVIAGGRCIPFWLLSRQVMEVVIPEDVTWVLDTTTGQRLVDVHVATPYGVTSHLMIPGIDWPPSANRASAKSLGYAFADNVVKLCYTVAAGQPPVVSNNPSVALTVNEPVGIAPREIDVTFLTEAGDAITPAHRVSYNESAKAYFIEPMQMAEKLLQDHWQQTAEFLSEITLLVRIKPVWPADAPKLPRTLQANELRLTFKPCSQCTEVGGVWPAAHHGNVAPPSLSSTSMAELTRLRSAEPAGSPEELPPAGAILEAPEGGASRLEIRNEAAASQGGAMTSQKRHGTNRLHNRLRSLSPAR